LISQVNQQDIDLSLLDLASGAKDIFFQKGEIMRDSYLAQRYFFLAITFLINLSPLNFTHAADVKQIEQVFREQFWQGLYQENRCGQNTQNFTRLLLRKNIDVQNLSSLYRSICDQNNTLDSVFGSNTNIDAVFKYETQWLYWDKASDMNSSYRMSKFSTISPKDGMLVKTNNATTVYLPFDDDATDLNNYQNMPSGKWLLLSNNVDQTVEQISSAASVAGKTIMYILLQRDGNWYVYAPTNDDKVDSTIARLNKVNKYESFWIYLK
jgi:hypothetical protein